MAWNYLNVELLPDHWDPTMGPGDLPKDQATLVSNHCWIALSISIQRSRR
ncbi:hypothetical protein [Nocardia rhamnosiphila]|uniref:Uncharacterized protein n=1 Tax=Nocardia rhamnosiphila TaxID=426716 RepID=A0ABV2WIU0_9NOCA